MKSFKSIQKNRIDFIKKNSKNDHCVLNGSKNILLSSPHGVNQIRNGKIKVCEPGSLSTALFLQNQTDCFLIGKTKCNNDDANYDEKSEYKTEIERLIKENDIKYVLDFHGLSKKREMDVNLGTDGFNNTKIYPKALNNLIFQLQKEGFIVEIDTPFRGGEKTISGFVQTLNAKVFSLQIEINCAITNDYKNFNKYKKLLEILTNWINSLK